MGEPPRFHAGPKGSGEQATVDRIAAHTDNGFVSTLYEVALDVSRYGDGLLKVWLASDGGARISGQPPSYWFPVVAPNDLRKVRAHVLAWTFELKYLWAEIHERGRIENRVYRLKGNRLAGRMAPHLFDPDRPEVEETGLDEFLIVPVPGLRASDEMFGSDDYEDLDSIVQALEVRAGQINRILDRHSDPSMYGPPDYAGAAPDTGEPLFEAGGRYFQVEDGDVPPGYIVWDGKLEAQFKEIETLMEQLYIISETSPAAFGQLKHGLAESGSALRRLMQAPLAKAARLRMRLDPAAVRALKLAAALERAQGRDTPLLEKLLIQWQDGLPPDPREMADTEAVRVTSGTTSKASAIRRLDGGTQEEAEAELARAMAEKEAASSIEVNRSP